MTGRQLPWPWLCAKGLMSGIVVFPILSIAPFLPILVSSSSSAGSMIAQTLQAVLNGVWVNLPYGLLFSGIMIWRSVIWAIKGLSERQRLGRAVFWGAILGSIWIGFILTKIHVYSSRPSEGALDWAEYALLISGLISGAVSGWLLVKSLGRELQEIQTAKG